MRPVTLVVANAGSLAKFIPNPPRDSRKTVLQSVLPHLEDFPSFSPEQTPGFTVAFHIPGDLGIPIFPVAGGHAAVLFAAVPEAPIDEYGDSLFRKYKIRPSGNRSVTAPAFDPGGAKKANENEFRRFVSARTNCRHDAGTLGLVESIGHAP